MFNCDLIVLSYHRFVEKDSDYRFSRTYEQFGHDISKKTYDWITIDDGMKCMIKACEMLRRCNIRAKLFITAGLVGEPGYCTWDELMELSKYHDIENHGYTHIVHPELLGSAQIDSILKCQQEITEKIGRAPRYFVPPYNQFNCDTEMASRSLGLILVKNRINILNISK